MSTEPLMLVARDIGVDFRLRRGLGAPQQIMTALDGVSFAVRRGEVLGVVGNNGAGKSTLLNALLGTVTPERGDVYARSQPVAMQIHARMDQELTGEQTAWIGLLSFGLTKADARQVLPGVIDFAELGAAIEQPVRTYSTGMRARLRFAIASARNPEILILDEALAVGDTTFKDKALARVEELRGAAGAVVMASHQLLEIERTCTQAMWLHGGHVKALGHVGEVLDAYRAGQDSAV